MKDAVVHGLDALCAMAIIALVLHRMIRAARFDDWRTFTFCLSVLALIVGAMISSLPADPQACTSCPNSQRGSPHAQ